MKHRSVIPKLLTFLVLIYLSLLTISCNQRPSAVPIAEDSADKSKFLYCSKASSVTGKLEIQPGDNMTWIGVASLTWEVDLASEGKYELYLIANVREEGKGKILSLQTDKKVYDFELESTNGPFINSLDFNAGRNFERIKLSSDISLTRGVQKLKLLTEGISTDDILFEIRAIELLPLSAKIQLKEENDRAIAARAKVDWMIEARYGLMFHWTSQCVQPDGSIKSYERAVIDFDVDRFANMAEETGAGYVFLTIGHAEQYCPAPIKSWEKLHPGKTTQRDLITEMANALNARGIKLLCYMHSMGTANFHAVKNKQFLTNFKNILMELGNRYQEKIAGYWFDCWYQIFEGYPEIPFEEFYKVTKAGNKDRIICLNSWIYPAVSPWQDYWAGEVGSLIELPVDGYAKNGPVTKLPYHVLLMMEPYWVQESIEISEPRFTSESLAEYITDCNKNKGAVSINLGIYQDGTVSANALQVMKEVKSHISTNK